jgi:hypothetical protein
MYEVEFESEDIENEEIKDEEIVDMQFRAPWHDHVLRCPNYIFIIDLPTTNYQFIVSDDYISDQSNVKEGPFYYYPMLLSNINIYWMMGIMYMF